MSDNKSAGSLALNYHNQIVWAGDRVHVTRDKQYRCICDAKCGCVLILKRGSTPLKSGNLMVDHFAYPSTGKKTGCTGRIPTPEAIEHNGAKWLIHDKLSEFIFWDVCGDDHRVGSSQQYDVLEWNCTVEKKIPGTKRIADILLENMCTGKFVAIEVLNTHKVDYLKAQECKAVNVHIIEVLASTVNAGIRVINNQRVCDEWDDCERCVQEKRNREELRAQKELDRKRDELIRGENEAELAELGKRKREEDEQRKREQEKVDREEARLAEIQRIEQEIETAHQDRISEIERIKLAQERERVKSEKNRLHLENVAKMRPELKKRMSSFFVQ